MRDLARAEEDFLGNQRHSVITLYAEAASRTERESLWCCGATKIGPRGLPDLRTARAACSVNFAECCITGFLYNPVRLAVICN